LRSGAVVIVRRGQDVYGRIVVDVYVGGRSVARVLNAEGYAKSRPRRHRRARDGVPATVRIFGHSQAARRMGPSG
jgi:endonuclease YncB( thermonuclease family)